MTHYGKGRDPISNGLRGGSSRGGGDGARSRGRGISQQDKIEIMGAKRTASLQVGSESTDDLLVSPTMDASMQNLARFILSKKDFDRFRSQKQMRDFVHSLLVNLSNHHTVDVSGLLGSLASETGRARLREILQSNMVINAGFENDRTSFQYVILPLVGVLTRENVCQSALMQESGLIFAEVYRQRFQFLDEGILPCMRELIRLGSMDDVSSVGRGLRANTLLLQVSSLQSAMLAIVRLVYHLVKRFQNAKAEMRDTIITLQEMVADCTQRSDTSEMSRFLNQHLQRECDRLLFMTSNSTSSVFAPIDKSATRTSPHDKEYKPNISHLELTYDPPGNLSPQGPRHNNDHAMIKDIQLVPTHDELTCLRPAFLPSNDIADAPHPLQPGWPRLLDTHFRLNREDMIDDLRRGITAFLDALRKITPGRRNALLNRKELRQLVGQDVNLCAYSNVEFLGTNVERKLQGSIRISFDQPSQLKGQSAQQRRIYWERSKRRLMQGSLVCFVFPDEKEGQVSTDGVTQGNNHNNNSHKSVQMSLGVIHTRDAVEMAKDNEKAVLHVSLTDHSDYCRIVHAINTKRITVKDSFMIESMGGFFEGYRPILRALQTCEPGAMPFGKYLAPTQDQRMFGNNVTPVDPPLYAQAPEFEFDLSILFQLQTVPCHLNVTDPKSRQRAITALCTHSTCDETQSKALVESLCREVALISGPPGTGKTRIGVDLMRVLLHNAEKMNCGPILCICYTNHALDQFLEHLLDEGIKNIVRIGSRSQSARLESCALRQLETVQDRSYAVRSALGKAFDERDEAIKELKNVERELRQTQPTSSTLLKFIQMDNYGQYLELQQGKDYGGDKNSKAKNNTIEINFQRWLSGADIKQMVKEKHKQKAMSKSSAKTADDHSVHPAVPLIPYTNRPLERLRNASLWKMSRQERIRLHDFWIAEVQEEIQIRYIGVMAKIENLAKRVNEAYDELRRGILRNAHVIGMTTNGAAKSQSMIAALQPKIIICEEAGEVLESHILASLSGSTQHLILIGDHLQLRPQIASYELSSDSKRGCQYNLDRSLFERLVVSQSLPSSRLATQRRMRPEICDLVRKTLYDYLLDGEKVLSYPNVSGMANNLYFMDHHHPEDNRDQFGIQSYANTFEAEMVKALVQHLLKNGYKQSSIAVLTPYLGQLSRLRDTLRDVTKLAIDERDQEQLEAKGDDSVMPLATGKPSTTKPQLTLRTIDNYQGEEADIVIISLVRSATRENRFGSASTIGFLKSPNRTNVLLSRARHGMFLIGNAALMNQNKNGIWPKIITELETHGRIGQGLVLRCCSHPDIDIPPITKPEDFAIYAPNGGCHLPCGQTLPSCGHVCPMLCHLDNSAHKIIKCAQPCTRLHRPCNHVCPKKCSEDCGDCTQIVGPLVLPCEHVFEQARCFQEQDPSKARCKIRVSRRLPRCEHEAEMDCCKDVNAVRCASECGVLLECGHPCTRNCHQCQSDSLNTGISNPPPIGTNIERTVHGDCQKRCTRTLHCGHICDSVCHEGFPCPPCKKDCSMACSHAKCKHSCLTLCAACSESCAWSCSHHGQCQLPCGAPCSRLPCNLRCEKMLPCNHQCPSVCGETCPPLKYCVECKRDANIMDMIVDVIMQAPLSDVDVNEDPILVLSCGHPWTMSSLDGLMKLNEYYDGTTDKTTGIVTYSRSKSLPNSEIPMVGCPTCRAPIVGLFRYGRRIKYGQLVMRLKKFEMVQSANSVKAEEMFNIAQQIVRQNLPAFLQKTAGVATSVFPSQPSQRSSDSSKCDNGSRLGGLVIDAEFPNSEVTLLHEPYGFPLTYEQAWTALIKPAVDTLKVFDAIYQRAIESPTRRLYEASISYLFNSKAISSLANESNDAGATRRLMAECAIECGLPPDGHAGSSFVRSIQGRSNVLSLVLHAASQAFEKANSTDIGWIQFYEDLLRCCEEHIKIQLDAAIKGRYPRIEMYARMSWLDVLYKRMNSIGRRPFSTYNVQEKANRQKEVDAVLAPFMTILKAIDDSGQVGLRKECLPRARDLESRMTTAVKIAMGELNRPPTAEEKFEIFRAMQKGLRGSGHWYRCPNGHPYVIADCGQAMEESVCYECGARVGGGQHRLRDDNGQDAEFEGYYRR